MIIKNKLMNGLGNIFVFNLYYSKWKYKNLTELDRLLISEESFNYMVNWLKEKGQIKETNI